MVLDKRVLQVEKVLTDKINFPEQMELVVVINIVMNMDCMDYLIYVVDFLGQIIKVKA